MDGKEVPHAEFLLPSIVELIQFGHRVVENSHVVYHINSFLWNFSLFVAEKDQSSFDVGN